MELKSATYFCRPAGLKQYIERLILLFFTSLHHCEHVCSREKMLAKHITFKANRSPKDFLSFKPIMNNWHCPY